MEKSIVDEQTHENCGNDFVPPGLARPEFCTSFTVLFFQLPRCFLWWPASSRPAWNKRQRERKRYTRHVLRARNFHDTTSRSRPAKRIDAGLGFVTDTRDSLDSLTSPTRHSETNEDLRSYLFSRCTLRDTSLYT